MYRKIISIGSTCQPAQNIRQQLKQPEAYYFDWLISSQDAVVRAIESDFDGVLRAGNLAYSDNRSIRVRDAANGLEYQHDFPLDKDNPDPSYRSRILPDFALHADAVREKYVRRAERFRAALSAGESVLLVRYVQAWTDLSDSRRQNLVGAFRRRFPSARFDILWASPLIRGFERTQDGWMCELSASDRWDGDPADWQRIWTYCGINGS